jgi:hypothetical protein
VSTFKKLALATGLCAIGAIGCSAALAQTTDGFHTIQVFPVVTDSTSFAQRFHFRNPNTATVNISATYLPGTGTTGVQITCPTFSIAAGADRTFTSLRAICPALAAGSQFGMLYTYEIDSANLPYAAYSRVANPQGNGFSIEAFPGSTFTSATSTVTGVRRLAASGGNPAFQTNCFVGNMLDLAPADTTVTETEVTVFSSTGAQLGATTRFALAPGKLTRIVDVFAAVGAPAGNHDNARVRFWEYGDDEPGLISFCTVQDNTSFGADFRIAKQESEPGGLPSPQDDHVLRNSTVSSDALRTFEIGAGASASNTHVVYVKHPDWFQCELIDPATSVRALSAYGLEMRMTASNGTTIIAGGSGAENFGETYMGDKTDRNLGSNTRYLIQVESNGANTASARPYRLRCQSGSGHSQMDTIAYKEVVNRF